MSGDVERALPEFIARQRKKLEDTPANKAWKNGYGEALNNVEHVVAALSSPALVGVAEGWPTRQQIAEAIKPEWFGPLFDGKHPLDNYDGQHKVFQKMAFDAADRVLALRDLPSSPSPEKQK